MAYNTSSTPVNNKAWSMIATTQQNVILQNVTPISEGIEIFVSASVPGPNQRGLVLAGLTGFLGKNGQAAPGESSVTFDALGSAKVYARAVRSTSELVVLEF